jgi:hypothetical protein
MNSYNALWSLPATAPPPPEPSTAPPPGAARICSSVDIKSYDAGHAHMLMFADTLTDGITKQFPDKFKG